MRSGRCCAAGLAWPSSGRLGGRLHGSLHPAKRLVVVVAAWQSVATIRTTHDGGGGVVVPDKKEICMLRKVDGFSLLEQPLLAGSILSCVEKKDSCFVIFKTF